MLLFQRQVEPFRGSWSLLGEVPDAETSMDKSAQDIIYKLTGVKDLYLSQLKTYGDLDRDPLERVISIVYYSLIRVDVFKKIDLKKHNAKWFALNEIPEIILDHKQMINDAISKLREIAKTEPLGFRLLPKLFTLPQLQNLYECLYGIEFDSRNFRKKILSSGFLKKTDKKDKTSSRKGAFLFSFIEPNELDEKEKKETNIKDVFQF